MNNDEILEEKVEDFYDALKSNDMEKARAIVDSIGEMGHETRALRLHRIANSHEEDLIEEYAEDAKVNNAVDAALGK